MPINDHREVLLKPILRQAGHTPARSRVLTLQGTDNRLLGRHVVPPTILGRFRKLSLDH